MLFGSSSPRVPSQLVFGTQSRGGMPGQSLSVPLGCGGSNSLLHPDLGLDFSLLPRAQVAVESDLRAIRPCLCLSDLFPNHVLCAIDALDMDVTKHLEAMPSTRLC